MLQIRQILQKTQKNENVLKTCLKRVKTVLEAERTILYVILMKRMHNCTVPWHRIWEAMKRRADFMK